MKIISIRNVNDFVEKITHKISKKNTKVVEFILNDVKKRGDPALKYYEKKFTGSQLKSIKISKRDIVSAYSKVSNDEISAIKTAQKRLLKTENAIKNQLKDIKLEDNGIKILKTFVPIKNVGCYVPGGLAKYPSSAIMAVVPAKVAGVKRIVVVSPSNREGNIDPLTIVASDLCGANEIYKIGGAQAIAALAYGTQTISPVDKIVGPGGQFVMLAKSLISNNTQIDMIAGPTELGIIVDASANLNAIVSSLFSQAEHSKDTFCFVLTTSQTVAKNIQKLVSKNIQKAKRKSIIQASLEKNGFIGVCKTECDIINLVNKIAPEHLEIITKKPQNFAKKILTAGLVLIGQNTPSSASDYLLGSNHILPTNGFGKTRGSLSVLDFIKLGTQIELSKPALRKLAKHMKTLTMAENLPNHYEAVRSRLL